MLIQWSDIQSVNVKELDEQHKKMVDIINKFFINGPDNKEGLTVIIKELIAYANYHLATEEAYFIKFNYEGAKEHNQKHQFYREKVQEFEKKFNQSAGEEFFREVSVFLKDWWIEHINKVDQAYGDFFNQKGLY